MIHWSPSFIFNNTNIDEFMKCNLKAYEIEYVSYKYPYTILVKLFDPSIFQYCFSYNGKFWITLFDFEIWDDFKRKTICVIDLIDIVQKIEHLLVFPRNKIRDHKKLMCYPRYLIHKWRIPKNLRCFIQVWRHLKLPMDCLLERQHNEIKFTQYNNRRDNLESIH